MWISNFNITAK